MTEPTAMPVRTGLQDRAFVITIDNPPVNVLGQAVRAALLDACDQAAKALGGGEADRVIVTGAGRAFVAGADTREFDGPALDPQLPDVLARLSALPAIAAINGAALGGGFEIALACRARIATPHALVGLPEVTLGVVPGAGGTQRLPRAVGKAKAMDMALTARMMDAAEAERAGLVSRVVPQDKLMEEALGAAIVISGFSQIAVMAAKESVNRAFEGTLSDGVMFERRLFHSLFATQDQKEGMDAFVNKRAPNFTHQ